MAKNNTYSPKSLVEGFKIGKQYSGKMFVAVPHWEKNVKYFLERNVICN